MTTTHLLDPVTVDVVSDVVCPWCFLGKHRLDRAIAMVPEVTVEVHFRPYILDESVPPAGVERTAWMEARFGHGGDGPARIRAVHESLTELGAAEDIPFAFDAIRLQPSSLDAHRLIRWAGVEGVQDEMVERLFRLFFCEGADIGDAAVLRTAAEACGMDGAMVARLLASDADTQAVAQEIETARRIGVTGVPCFIFDGRLAVMGAESAETLAMAIRQAFNQRAEAMNRDPT
ncbi:DsbA family oxidoreductase [Pseudoxanthobacter sp.]|uniref:DsbA family oxidoreductase n=1 Tax=Pseudoxanthobacter sp. TaxID=1925742 RepID=UPI002FE1CFF8